MLVGNADWRGALPALARLLLAIIAVAGYGYVLNDVFDIEEDGRRGKVNSMAGLRRWQQAALLVSLASLSLAPLVGGPFGPESSFLVAANLVLPMLYSIPPIRLKERGILGVLADAMGVHVVPTLVFAVSIARLSEPASGSKTTALVLVAAVWALVTGARGIIVHQVKDRESDLSAGVRTFGGGLDPATARKVIFRRIFPAELLALSVLLAVVVPVAPILIGVIPVYLSSELLKVLDDWRLPLLEPDGLRGEPYIPLEHNDLYEVWLPLSLSVQLSTEALPFAILPVFQVVAFLPNLRFRLGELVSLSPVLRWFATGNGRPPLSIAPYSESEASERGLVSRKASDEVRAFVEVTRWSWNGVNAFSADLARGLSKRGLGAVILLIEAGATPGGDEGGLDRPGDVPFAALPPIGDSRWRGDWVALIRFLEYQAPCVYVPNGELRHSSVIPLLSDKVGVARVAHHEPDHLAGEYRKVFEAKEGLGGRTYRRSGSPMRRLGAFARLCAGSQSRSADRAGS
jgi:4-hydroxybenzoate polyprenyltransferase